MTLDVLIIAEQLRRAAPGGIGTYVRGLVQGLASLDRTGAHVRPTLWSSGGAPLPIGPLPIGDAQSPVARLTAPWPSQLLTRLWDRGLVCFPAQYNVGHATSLAIPRARRDGPPVTAFVHDLLWRALPDTYPARGRRWHEAALGRAVQRAHAILVPSTDTADELLATGTPSKRIVVTGEGSDHLALSDRWDGDYILAVSTLEPRKNLHRLIESYGLARARLSSPAPLKIVGAFGWGSSIPTPQPGVEFVGSVTDLELSRLYAGARAFVYIPLREGWGLPPTEAMRAGVPVVASAMPSRGGAALTVDPHNVAAVADALVRVCTDDATRDDLVGRGLAHAASLKWSDVAQMHVDLWRDLVR